MTGDPTTTQLAPTTSADTTTATVGVTAELQAKRSGSKSGLAVAGLATVVVAASGGWALWRRRRSAANR